MAQYKTLNLKWSTSQLANLKSGIQNSIKVTENFSSNEIMRLIFVIHFY